MRLYEWKNLEVRHHPDKFGDCDSEYLMFLACHVTSSVQVFQGLRGYIVGSPSR